MYNVMIVNHQHLTNHAVDTGYVVKVKVDPTQAVPATYGHEMRPYICMFMFVYQVFGQPRHWSDNVILILQKKEVGRRQFHPG